MNTRVKKLGKTLNQSSAQTLEYDVWNNKNNETNTSMRQNKTYNIQVNDVDRTIDYHPTSLVHQQPLKPRLAKRRLLSGNLTNRYRTNSIYANDQRTPNTY